MHSVENLKRMTDRRFVAAAVPGYHL